MHLNDKDVPEGYQGTSVDIFSAGVVLFNLLFAERPFKDAASDDYYYQHLFRGSESADFWNKQAARNIDVNSVSVQTLHLIESMLSANPLNRPSVRMIIEMTESIIRDKMQYVEQGSLEAIPLKDELYNRHQFMLI